MAVTIDARPSYFGDRMIVTGTYAATDTSIALSGLLASIDAVIVNPVGAGNLAKIQHIDIAGGTTYAAVDCILPGDMATFSGTTITIAATAIGHGTLGGTFLAIGRRS
tara:strand:+ start:628 stop:951 length:324 start_codon:yes stop_codon:yes gene_type:complete